MDTVQMLAFRRMITDAVKRDASDLHLSVGSRPMIRVDGSLRPMDDEDVLTHDAIQAVVGSFTDSAQRELLATAHDILFTTVFENRIRAKIHIFHQEGFMTVSIRFLSLNVKTLKELTVAPAIQALADMKNGLILVGGSNGSGRTTLAVALLEQINRSRIEHIMTIENPMEYNILSNKSVVNQREVGRDVASMEDALSFAFKEDIDVLYVSELQNATVIRSCLELAAAGNLVVCVVNANSSVMALEKLLAYFEEHEKEHIQSLLADVLKACVIQALVPKVGGGSIAIHELLLNTASAKTLIASSRVQQLEQLIKSSRAEGMMSMDHELAMQVRAHVISGEHAKLVAHDVKSLETLIRS